MPENMPRFPESVPPGTRYFLPKTSRRVSLGGINRVCVRLGFPALDMNDCWRVRAGQPPRVLTLAQNFVLRRALGDLLPEPHEVQVA